MLKAEQLALIQEANQQLLAIRQLELGYYTSVFSNFGTIAALLAGFSLSALTLDPTDFDVNEFWRFIYWISCTCCLCSSLHCILTTTFANVFGTGLALRGQTGSMVRVVDGLLEEKEAIFNSFLLSVCFFQLIALSLAWIIMNDYATYICSFVMIVASYVWYKYCRRIYIRFFLKEEQNVAWNSGNNGPTISRDSEDTHDGIIRAGTGAAPNISSSGDAVKPASKGLFGGLFGGKNNSRNNTTVDDDSYSIMSGGDPVVPNRSGAGSGAPGMRSTASPSVASSNGTGTTGSGRSKLFMEGYMTKKGGNSGPLGAESWTRRYFVLKGCNLYYYTSREVYEQDPSKSIKNRPLDVTGYAVTRSPGDNAPFSIELTPPEDEAIETTVNGASVGAKRRWCFQADTLHALEQWTDALRKASGEMAGN